MTKAPATTQLDHGEVDLGIVDALAQLSFLVQGTLAKHAAAQDLSMIQTRLLGVLRDREPTMQELARLLGLDKSSVTGLVDRAEKRGLVQREPSIDDRRAVRVQLSAEGRRIGKRVSDGFKRDVAAATQCLSPVERTRLSILATRVLRAQPKPTRGFERLACNRAPVGPLLRCAGVP